MSVISVKELEIKFNLTPERIFIYCLIVNWPL